MILQPPHGVEQCRVSQVPVSPAPDTENGNLFVLHTRSLREPVHGEIGKVLAQDPRADSQLGLWNYKHQDAAGLEPTISMFRKHQFQSLIIRLTGFQVVRRVEIKKRATLCRAAHIHGIRLQSVDAWQMQTDLPREFLTDSGIVMNKAGARRPLKRCGTRILCGAEMKSHTECGFSCELWVRSWAAAR